MTDWKIYLAGPMSGIDEFNFPAFHKYAKLLRAYGFVVLSPAETAGQVVHLSKEWYMAVDLNYVGVADEVILLPGWRHSAGAKTEAIVATALGKKVTEILPDKPGLYSPLIMRRVNIDLAATELLEGPC